MTGYLGFIGRHLLKRLVGNEIFLVDREIGKNILEMGWFPKVDLVYHLAAQTRVINSIEKPLEDAMDNILATIKLLEQYGKDTRMVYTGSAGCGVDPVSPYGLSKRTAGEYIKMLAKDYVICNLPNVYGWGDDRVVTSFLNSEKIIIYGNGQQTRDFVYIDDIVGGLLKAKDWPTGEYDFGSGTETKIIDLAKMFNKEIEFLPKRWGEKDNSCVANTTPDWKPEISLEEGIKLCQLQ